MKDDSLATDYNLTCVHEILNMLHLI